MNYWALFPIFLFVFVGRLVFWFLWGFAKGMKKEWPTLVAELRKIKEEEKERKREQKMRDAEAHEDLDSTTMQAKRDHDR